MIAAQVSTAERLGVPSDSFVDFRERTTARHLRYMDLLPSSRRNIETSQVALEGVVEVSGKAALYVVRGPLLTQSNADGREVVPVCHAAGMLLRVRRLRFQAPCPVSSWAFPRPSGKAECASCSLLR